MRAQKYLTAAAQHHLTKMRRRPPPARPPAQEKKTARSVDELACTLVSSCRKICARTIFIFFTLHSHILLALSLSLSLSDRRAHVACCTASEKFVCNLALFFFCF